ncbi:gonadotropin-releasing hormone II receptor-like isoform X2 [Thunnus maccoyii]|uniref:gonadotropin-releasing hormone II receptor-like isoform X2 n=1 Tax=Thunnus maccoyii TaxID=8240 RepID=UPI001C4D5602|nr:gonadotropin-releasing hormone II receptor-like isoform X2 [Thunnus maccoyii]
MNASSCCEPPVTMYQQSSGYDLNSSCDWLAPHCNWTSVDKALQLPTFSTAAKVRVIITFILCGISSFCNLAVLWAASGHKRKSHVRVLIVNLTAADLLVTFIVMPVDAVWNITVQWLAGDLACRFLMFLKLQAMYSCAFITVVISLDRQSAILNPLAIGMAPQRNRVMLTVAWTMSALFSIPQCTTRGSFVTHWQETAYNMFTFSCLFLLPLVIMIICYTRIFIQISKRMTKKSLSPNEPHLRCSKNNIPKARMRTLKMSIVIVICFIVCWTPYYLLGLWYWFFPDDLEGKVSHSLTHILFIFGLFNTCLDPIIYGLFTIRFRKRLRTCYRKTAVMSDKETNTTVITESLKCTAKASPSKRGMTSGENDSNCAQLGPKSTDSRCLTVSVEEEEEGSHAMSVHRAQHDEKNRVETEI